MDCNNTNLKKGSTGNTVKEAQTLLQQKGYYTGKLDGDYGNLTVEAVKKYQKANSLLSDGIFGPVTCKKIQTSTTGIYHSGPHWTGAGCNKLGQCTGYYCGVHCLRQVLAKFGIDNYNEQVLAGWAGTTHAGTSHYGIETALRKVNQKEGTNITIEWFNFSDFGKTSNERWKRLGEIISQPNKDAIIHNLYRNKFGHYEVIQEINTNNNTVKVLNSLGNKCSSISYCGYIETRSFQTFNSYIVGISQKSIAILTRK